MKRLCVLVCDELFHPHHALGLVLLSLRDTRDYAVDVDRISPEEFLDVIDRIVICRIYPDVVAVLREEVEQRGDPEPYPLLHAEVQGEDEFLFEILVVFRPENNLVKIQRNALIVLGLLEYLLDV